VGTAAGRWKLNMLMESYPAEESPAHLACVKR
jgi:hypothetical protein